jgi:aspartate aminotransferase, mitochondrial
MPDNSVILFQMVGHNPTASDPSVEQWREMSDVLQGKNVLAFFDMAYQGFGSGCLETDAFPVRHFIEEGHRVVFAQSYSKNMGLYSVRVGGVTFMTDDKEDEAAISNQLRHSIEVMYKEPPIHGSRVVEEIFSKPELKNEWQSEVKMMNTRILEMRLLLSAKLKECGSIRDWSHLTKQRGMFFYSGLSVKQCERLINEYSKKFN